MIKYFFPEYIYTYNKMGNVLHNDVAESEQVVQQIEENTIGTFIHNGLTYVPIKDAMIINGNAYAPLENKVSNKLSIFGPPPPTRVKPTPTTSVAIEETDPLDNVPVIRRALFIGINYIGSQYELHGCINDALHLKTYLITNKYFNEDECIVMSDNQPSNSNAYPSRMNILKQFAVLISFAAANPDKKVELFISYSGHGSNVRDVNGDEADGFDEVICPADFDSAGFIVDDYIKAEFVDKLGANVRVVILMDSCNSGTVVDLKYNYKIDGTANAITYNEKDTACKIVMVSGCRDNQTSADAYLFDKNDNKYEYQGAMTAAFLANYIDGISYENLITNMRAWLKQKSYTQVPQLSSGQPIAIKKAFMLCKYNNTQPI